MSDEKLSPEDAKALADKIIDKQFIPKKVPAADDVDGQTQAIAGALASSLLTATEMPLHVLQPYVADVAKQMRALGIRQTEHVAPDAIHAPAWITDGVRQESIKLPDPPKHTDGEPFVARTATAPEPPKRITKAARAVRQ